MHKACHHFIAHHKLAKLNFEYSKSIMQLHLPDYLKKNTHGKEHSR